MKNSPLLRRDAAQQRRRHQRSRSTVADRRRLAGCHGSVSLLCLRRWLRLRRAAPLAQINASSPVKVGWGFTPLNLFHQTRIRLGAERLPAREVMRRILERFPPRITWRLNYDPTTKRYYLSFLMPASENRGIPDVNQGL